MSLLITTPEAVGGYQTDQMLYIKTPYALSAFVRNSWIATPANMLFPLIVQSLQYSQVFHAIASTPYTQQTDYRLDTQLFELQQNYLFKPSVVQLKVKAVLTHVEDNRIVGSAILGETIPCSQDTPYGGVVAANKATQALTEAIVQFVVKNVQQDTAK